MNTESQRQIALETARKEVKNIAIWLHIDLSVEQQQELTVILIDSILSAIERATIKSHDNGWLVAASNEIVDTLENENLTLNKSEWVGKVHQIIREAQPQHSEQQQEWTPEYVAGLMARSPLKNRESELLRGYGAVSDAHNAALAYWRKRWKDDTDLKHAEEEVRVMTNQCVQLRQELAAERQRRGQAELELGAVRRESNSRLQQLLSALAAIEKHEHDFEECDGAISSLADLTASRNALHQHDKKLTAEVRKPLVEALEKYFALTSSEPPHKFARAERELRSALAKVKEASEAQPYCPSTRFGSGT